MCAVSTLRDYDTTGCLNVGCVQLEHLEMWEIIFNLGSFLLLSEKKYM